MNYIPRVRVNYTYIRGQLYDNYSKRRQTTKRGFSYLLKMLVAVVAVRILIGFANMILDFGY